MLAHFYLLSLNKLNAFGIVAFGIVATRVRVRALRQARATTMELGHLSKLSDFAKGRICRVSRRKKSTANFDLLAGCVHIKEDYCRAAII